MGAWEDALAQIQGPSIEDLLNEPSSRQPAPSSADVQETTTATTTTPRLGVPSRGSITKVATNGPTTEGPTSTPVPQGPPPVLPKEQPEGEGLAKSFLLDPIFNPVDEIARSRHFPTVARMVAAYGGGLIGTAAGMPTAGALAGAALVEPGLQDLEQEVHGEPRSLGRGALNVAAAGLRGAAKYLPVRESIRAGAHLIDAAALNSLYEVARSTIDEGSPNWFEAGRAVSSPWNLIGPAFGIGEYAMGRARANLLRRTSPWSGKEQEHADRAASIGDEEGWFSYNPRHGGDMRRTGQYSVSLPGISEVVPPGGDVRAALKGFIERHREYLDQGLGIGSFKSDDGSTSLELNTYTRSRQQAIWLGKKWDQWGVGDMGTEARDPSPIETGGSGAKGAPPTTLQDAHYMMNGHPVGRLLATADKAADSIERLRARVPSLDALLGRRKGAIGGEEYVPPRTIEEMNARVARGGEPLRKGGKLYNDLAAVGAGHMAEYPEFPDWADRMKADYPDLPAETLEGLYERGRVKYAKFMAKSLFDMPQIRDLFETYRKQGLGEVSDKWVQMRPTLEQIGFPKDVLDHVIAMFAASSARNTQPGTTTMAMRFFTRWLAAPGDPGDRAAVATEKGGTGSVRKMVRAILEQGPDAEVGALKIRNMLKYPRDPDAIVVDFNNWQLLGMPGAGPANVHEYRIAESIMRDIARRRGFEGRSREYWTPAWVGRVQGEGRAPTDWATLVRMRALKRDEVGVGITDYLAREAGKSAEEIREKLLSQIAPEEEAAAPKSWKSFIREARERQEAGVALTPERSAGQGAFDWETGGTSMEQAEADLAARRAARQRAHIRARKGQRGAMRLDFPWLVGRLAVWGAHQVMSGATAPYRLARRMVEYFGPEVTPAAGEASKRAAGLIGGLRGSYQRAGVQPGADRATINPVEQSAGKGPQTEREGLIGRYGKAGELMADLLDQHKDDIARSTRGSLDEEQLQKLADETKIDLVNLAKKFGRGQAANAEQIKRIRDLAYTLDERIASRLRAKQTYEPQGKWLPTDEAELAQLTQSYVALHTAKKATAAEAGRALAAHRLTQRLRNTDLSAMVEHAQRKGLDPEKIATIFQEHSTPYARAKAIEAATKLGWKDYYAHARRYTLLADLLSTPGGVGFSNVLGGMLRSAGKGPSAVYDKLFHRGDRWMYAHDLSPTAIGMTTGWLKGFRVLAEYVRHGGALEDLNAGRVQSPELLADRPIAGLVANLPFRLVAGVDAATTIPWAEGERQGFAYARAMKMARDQGLSGTAAHEFAARQAGEWVTSPPEWLELHTERLRKQISMQGPLGEVGSQAQRLIRKLGPAGVVISPFFRAAANEVKEAVKSTPLGMAMARRYGRGAASPAAARALARQRGIPMEDVARMEESAPGSFQESLAREAAVTRGQAMGGTGAVAALTLAVLAGAATVRGDKPQTEREAQAVEAEDGGPHWNQTRVGDVWLANNRMAALGPALNAMGNLQLAIRRYGITDPEDPRLDSLVKSFWPLVRGLAEAGPMGELSDLAGLMDNPSTAQLGRLAASASVLPEIGGKVQAYLDPYKRRVETFQDPFTQAFSPSSLAPVLDRRGEPVPRPTRVPVFKGRRQAEDFELNEASKAGVVIGPPNVKKLQYKGQEFKLNLRDRRILNRALGLANRAALKQAIGDEEWDRMGTEERREYLTEYRDKLRQAVHDEALGQLIDGQALNGRALIEPLRGMY